jgi:hypothetical protein
MFSFQLETRLGGVIEGLAIKTYQSEALPVMLHMTTRAVGLTQHRFECARVEARVRVNAVLDSCMALEAFEIANACSEIVA